MNLVITNPLGFWALLGIPAVVLIHFLQRQAKVLPVSTLFLLNQTQRESVSGRRFDRLTNSIPLWLQLLIVLLLTWLLVQPRYQRETSTQQVAVVLDSSASMSVVQDRVATQLRSVLPGLKGAASRIELYLFESDPERPILYAGDDLEAALTTLESWSPLGGATDPDPVLRLARSRISREGILVYVTDSPVEQLPFDAAQLSVGEPVANVGFTGASFENSGTEVTWKALVRNHSDSNQTRTWQVHFEDGSASAPREITLAPNGMQTISAGFPTDSTRLRVTLSPDAFLLDDELPLIAPSPKVLRLMAETSPKFEDLSSRLAGSFPGVEPTTDPAEADLVLASYDPLLPVLPSSHGIVVVDETTQSRTYLRGGIVAEEHPLMAGLNWQSLLVRESIQLELTEQDEILLWQGNRPLIALRSRFVTREPPGNTGEPTPSPEFARQLIFNFDLTLSNALKLPATVVLLHRFLEDLRSDKVAPEARNTETGQELAVSINPAPDAPPLALTRFTLTGTAGERKGVPIDQVRFLRAPTRPGYFRLEQGGDLILDSACHFADTREADLRSCASRDLPAGLGGEAIQRQTREDRWWRIWVLLTVLALLLAWHFTKDRPRDDEESSPAPLVPPTPSP